MRQRLSFFYPDILLETKCKCQLFETEINRHAQLYFFYNSYEANPSVLDNVTENDLILVFGNPDIRTAEYAAKLFLDGMGFWLMFSGNEGTFTKGRWDKPEAHVFRDIAVQMGVPESRIIVEDKARNTGENVTFSYRILENIGLIDSIRSLTIVQMPIMERRTFATFAKQWPGRIDLRTLFTSPDIEFSAYPNSELGDMNMLISMMLGCVQRIKEYPLRGFQIEQHIPEEVSNATDKLMSIGTFIVQ